MIPTKEGSSLMYITNVQLFQVSLIIDAVFQIHIVARIEESVAFVVLDVCLFLAALCDAFMVFWVAKNPLHVLSFAHCLLQRKLVWLTCSSVFVYVINLCICGSVCLPTTTCFLIIITIIIIFSLLIAG